MNCALGRPNSGCPGGDYDLTSILPPYTSNTVSSLPSSALTSSPEGFLNKYGSNFNTYSLTAAWHQSTLNRGRLPTRGESQSVSGEIAVPGSDVEFWKMIYRGQYFQPVSDDWVIRFRSRLGYGEGYGDTSRLPFYENFFAGGLGSVRGYMRSSVGPHDTPAQVYWAVPIAVTGGVPSKNFTYVYDPATGKLETLTLGNTDGVAFGGNTLVEGSMDLIFPTPFVKDKRSTQSSLFIDSGSAFDTQCDKTQKNCFSPSFNQLRYAYGVGITWVTGFGPLTFSIARPFHREQYDKTEFFQFALGQSF